MPKVPQKGIEPSGLVSSVLNWMQRLEKMVCSRNLLFCVVFWMTKMSSTYFLHSLGGLFDVLMALHLKLSMEGWPLFGFWVIP